VDGLDVVIEVLQTARVIGEAGCRVYLEVHHTHPAVFEGSGVTRKERRAMTGMMTGCCVLMTVCSI